MVAAAALVLAVAVVAITPMASAGRSAMPAAWTASASPSVTAMVRLSGVPLPKPTNPTNMPVPSAPRSCRSGQVIATAAWSATVPAGWACENGPRVGGVLGLRSAQSVIYVGIDTHASAGSECGSELGGDAKIASLPPTMWGGKPAITLDFRTEMIGGQVRCLAVKEWTYVMMGIPTETYEGLVADMDSLASSWVWK